MRLEPGDDFAGYRVDRILGRGGMGVVYLARDLTLERSVALKLVAPELAADAGFRERFLRESRVAASLEHPNIVPIYEAREADGQLYLAMRYVAGSDLRALLLQAGRLDVARTLALLAQVADALDAAHDAGLVHRDVKPGNILVAPAGRSVPERGYLVDFGLTRRREDSAGPTRTGQVVGTVDYMAPEQIEGRALDGRTDEYALGCVMFECLAGGPPFSRDSEVAVLLAHLRDLSPSLHAARADVPHALDRVLHRALAKDPDDRYPTCSEFVRAALAAAAAPAETPTLPQGSQPVPVASPTLPRERRTPLGDVPVGDTRTVIAAAPRLRDGRRTLAFLFAQLRGYPEFVEHHGDRAAADLLATFRRVVRETVSRFGGAEVRADEGSMQAVFPSASSAVECGLGLVIAAADETLRPPRRPISVAVGIHAGETVETDEGHIGSAVHIATGVAAAAEVGEVLVTEPVRHLARTSVTATYSARGRPKLAGIDESIPVYAVAATPVGRRARILRPLARRARGAAAFGLRELAAAVVVTVLASVGGLVVAQGPSDDSGPRRPSGDAVLSTEAAPPSLDGSRGTAAAILPSPEATVDPSAVSPSGPGSSQPSQSPRGSPAALVAPALGSGPMSLHTCALQQTGRIACWGANGDGQLGDGTTTPRLHPVQVQGVTDATLVSVGSDYTCAVRETGQVACWGDNSVGQLGDGGTTDSPTPVPVRGISDATVVAAGGSHTCAVRRTGRIACWGHHGDVKLGHGGTDQPYEPVEVRGIRGAVSVAPGLSHTCATLGTGRVQCWGDNLFGQLGTVKAPESPAVATVPGISDATAIVAGKFHSCALREGGRVACWGNHGLDEHELVTEEVVAGGPVELVGMQDAKGLAAGGDHSCVLRGSGRIVCWGSNEFGQLGDGGTASRRIPREVERIADAEAVVAGEVHACAVRKGGHIECWGANGSGQVGDGTSVPRVTPTEVVPLAE